MIDVGSPQVLVDFNIRTTDGHLFESDCLTLIFF